MLILISGETNSGKTTIINKLRSDGFNCFVADEYVSSIYEKDGLGYNLIKSDFGDEFINDVGVDKSKIAQLILSDQESFHKLCSLIWPVIRDKILEIKRSGIKTIVELAIYSVDYLNVFDDLFDITISLKPGFFINNNKSKFESLYKEKCIKKFDYEITNHDSNQTFLTIKNIVNKN
ncbi:MAG: dephospho-CoA kinase [Mycoplasma sp.]